MKPGRSGVHGNALMIAVVMIAVFIATTGSMLTFALVRSQATTEQKLVEQQSRAIDAALAVKMNQIGRFKEDSIVGEFADGTKYAVICRPHLAADMFKLTAAVRGPNSRDAVWTELIVERTIQAGASAFQGAIMAKQKIETSGNSIANGNCFNLAEKRIGLGYCPPSHFDPVTGVCNNAVCTAQGNVSGHPFPHKASAPSIHDTLAIVTMHPGPAGVVVGGGSNAGGCGDPVADSPNDETDFPSTPSFGVDGSMAVVDRKQNVQWNRDFGQTPEQHFPTNPDELLDSPFGSCKKRALEKGTYFTTKAAFEGWVADLPSDRVPVSSVIYCDFLSTSGGGNTVDLDQGLDYGKSYHVLIQHYPKVADVGVPRFGVSGATMTAYTDMLAVLNKSATIGGVSYSLDDRDQTHECSSEESGSVTNTAPTTTKLRDSTKSSTNDTYNGSYVRFTSGTNAGLSRLVEDYVGSTNEFQVAAFPSAPAKDDTFVLDHGPYRGALIASADHVSFTDSALHAVGSTGHAAGAPKWDGFGYRKTEPDGISYNSGFQTKIFGVVIIDDQSNMNSSSLIFGGLATLAGDDASSKNLCNGGARIRYSAAAIDKAIAQNLATGASCDVKSYREHTPTRDAQEACRQIGVAITIPASPEDREDTATTSANDTVDGWYEPFSPTVAAQTVG